MTRRFRLSRRTAGRGLFRFAALPGLALAVLCALLLPNAALARHARAAEHAREARPATDGLVVADVRLGIHQDQTRIVFDLSAKPTWRLSAHDRPYRLILALPGAAWRGGALTPREGILRKISPQAIRDGVAVTLTLKRPARVEHAMILPPEGNFPYRLVFDLAPTSRREFLAHRAKPTEGRGAATPARAVPRPKPRKLIVAIDPGHGGTDPGTIGLGGIFEKNVTLPMARVLARELAATGRFKPFLTRDRDVFIPLRQRVAEARAAKADLFISLHADTSTDHALYGTKVYTLSQKASDKEAAALAAKENRADLAGGLVAGVDLSHERPEVANILVQLAQRDTMNRSAVFANMLVHQMGRVNHLVDHSHRFAGFAVLKALDVPSVLIEMGYLSNRRDEKHLLSPRYRAKFAAAIVRSVEEYFTAEAKNESGTAPIPVSDRPRPEAHH